jgi:endonuclease G, mitochondrial
MGEFSNKEKTIYKDWFTGKELSEIAKAVKEDLNYVKGVVQRINAEAGTLGTSILTLGKLGIIKPIPVVRKLIEEDVPSRGVETGFVPDFLSVKIELPKLTATNKQTAYILNGSEVIDYTHFSLSLNRIRRFPFWVGWNIDGGNIKKVSRKGIPFVLDPDIPKQFQVGEELYVGNRLDRGHIARRADLIWGGLPEAKKANKDSFFFTNITPQIDDFNQGGKGGLWGRLEDAVFEDTDVENLRVSLFGGPVFREDDREFRGVKLPREFWKVIAFVQAQKLKAKGFLLTQNLDELQVLELDQFRVFQVALPEIEGRCGLKFSAALKAADSVGDRLSRRAVSLSQRKSLASLQDIDWS